MIYCTVTTDNNLLLARNMAQTVRYFNPQAIIAVCVVEEILPKVVAYFPEFDYVVLAKELAFPNFYQHIFKNTATEACTSVKGRFLQHIWEKFPEEDKLIYLDGDVEVYGKFDEVEQLLDTKTLIVTPHILYPMQMKTKVKNKELVWMNCGIYNLGFLAIKKSRNACCFLEWWISRLEMHCYFDFEEQVFTDQRWLDYAPAFFDTHVLKHPGYNVTMCNVKYRQFTWSKDGDILVNGEPLRFYHFSGVIQLKGDYSAYFKQFHVDKDEIILGLIRDYVQELKTAGHNFNEKKRWSYSYFLNGEQIEHETRKNFRNHMERYRGINNPFLCSNHTFLSSDELSTTGKYKEHLSLQKLTTIGKRKKYSSLQKLSTVRKRKK